MSLTAVAAIGERERVSGFALAGVLVAAAGDADSVRAAWDALPADVGLVILTQAARAALASKGLLAQDATTRLWTVMPG